jgi:hypothetical protein
MEVVYIGEDKLSRINVSVAMGISNIDAGLLGQNN